MFKIDHLRTIFVLLTVFRIKVTITDIVKKSRDPDSVDPPEIDVLKCELSIVKKFDFEPWGRGDFDCLDGEWH